MDQRGGTSLAPESPPENLTPDSAEHLQCPRTERTCLSTAGCTWQLLVMPHLAWSLLQPPRRRQPGRDWSVVISLTRALPAPPGARPPRWSRAETALGSATPRRRAGVQQVLTPVALSLISNRHYLEAATLQRSESVRHGHRVPGGEDDKVLGTDGGDVCPTMAT